MALYKLEDYNPNYRQEAFNGEDIKEFDVYAGANNEKIGSVHDALVDETGRFRYLVIDTGFWIFGKKVLLPIGRCRIDADNRRVYATGLASKKQAEDLPEYDERMTVDYDYEERVRGVYRTPTAEESAPVETTAPVEAVGVPGVATQPVLPRRDSDDRDTYTYEREPALYQTNEHDHQKLRLYEERLVANKNRHKTGEVAVGKRVETETARVSVPVEKERVVVEHSTASSETPVTPGDRDFREGEVARIEVYEETADIHKQAFVREEVSVRKETDRDTIETTDRVRREKLDVKTEGHPAVDDRHLTDR
ncbi:DUF2382 domain-containing protein [Kamptonema formosum]|uniref:DUF2382 domain-containing protein n=1 Tax=Kamptonema formosum TaxID=331992 RepID=UPI00034D96A6|nr:DUF2382 domain-containing protein [Oscillatoria sp. PCC 10802]